MRRRKIIVALLGISLSSYFSAAVPTECTGDSLIRARVLGYRLQELQKLSIEIYRTGNEQNSERCQETDDAGSALERALCG
jgi:hypothetical protein